MRYLHIDVPDLPLLIVSATRRVHMKFISSPRSKSEAIWSLFLVDSAILNRHNDSYDLQLCFWVTGIEELYINGVRSSITSIYSSAISRSEPSLAACVILEEDRLLKD